MACCTFEGWVVRDYFFQMKITEYSNNFSRYQRNIHLHRIDLTIMKEVP